MEQDTYTLVRLRALMDQDQARMREGKRLCQKWLDISHKANYIRTIIIFIAIPVFITAVVIFGRQPIFQPIILHTTLITAFLIGLTLLIPLPAQIAFDRFRKGDEAFIKTTWKANSHPEITLVWNDNVNLFEVYVAADGVIHEVGMISKGDSFLKDFDEFVE